MSMTQDRDTVPTIREQRTGVDRRHFKIIFVVAFLFYIVALSFGRLLPASWKAGFCGFEPKTGVFRQARVQANILASYAIMN